MGFWLKFEKKLEKRRAVCLIIALLTLIIYCNSFSAPFTLDDFSSISNNYAIRNPLDVKAIWKFYSSRFVLYFTISVNYFLHAHMVEGYHIVNVALHILNGMVFFLIVSLLLCLPHFKNTAVARFRNTVSLLCALLFVAHPVQVNAVTYIIQRTASLAAAFYMLSILFFLKFRITGKMRFFPVTLLFVLLAMFTKENTVTLPLMLLCIELLFFLKDGRTTWRQRLLFLGILLLTVPVIPVVNKFPELFGSYNMSDPQASFKASTQMNRSRYFFTQMNVIVRYIKLLFFPDRLNFDYSNDFPLSDTIWEHNAHISFLLLALIGFLGLAHFRRNKLVCLGILWFYIGLSVESSIFSIKDVYFEHRLYFPVGGFLLFLLGMIFYVKKRDGRYWIRNPLLFLTVLSGTLLLLYGGFTLQRNYIFSDGIRLWSDVVAKAPGSDRAHSVLATNYLDAYEAMEVKKEEYLDRAEQEFKKALALNDHNDTAHCNLAKVYLLKKNYEKCIEEANITNRLGESTYAFHNLGLAYKEMGEKEKAIRAFTDGYRLDGKCTFILKSLGNIYYESGDYGQASFYYEEFLKYNDYSDSKEIKEKLKGIRNFVSGDGSLTQKEKNAH